jgi:hypothetical protein
MIYFVTEQYVKLNTPITDNVDMNEVQPLFKTAADGYVRSILGTYFYNYLLTEFNAQTLNANEIILVQQYVQPAVAWRICTEAVVTTSYQLKNKGIQTQNGDFSAFPGMSEMSFTFHHYRDRADFYDQRLLDYLKVNGDLYPDFVNPLNNDTIVPHKAHCNRPGNAFQSGITFI